MPQQIVKICRCLNCRREYPFDKFYDSKAQFTDNGNKVPYCIDCCEEILKYYITRMGTLEAGLWYTCAKLDIPFIKKCYDAMERQKASYQNKTTRKTAKKDTDYNLFAWYYSYLFGKSTMWRPTDLWRDFGDTDVSYEEVMGLKKDENIRIQLDKYIMDWGKQDTTEDYEFLSYCFDKYTSGVNIENPTQEDLYRDLCLARLKKRKIDEGRSGDDSAKAQAQILSLLKTLKLDDFESNKPKTLSEQSLINKITMVNENNVSDIYKEPNPKYKDFNKLQRYYKDQCLRPLGNMLAGHRDFNISVEDIDKYNLD